MNEVKIKSTWAAMGRRLAVALPLWVLKRLDERSEGKGLAVKAIPFVIMFLSVASIANLAGRAYIHHENFSAYMTGAGIAVLVPIAVIAAMIVEGRWAWGFWAMAVVFAGISGTIQYNIYLLPNSGAMGIAEAIAFGFGVPLSEVMLAIMEARLVIQHENKKAATEKAAQDAAIAAESAAKAAQLDAERKAEEERQRAITEQRAEAERQRQAAIDAENREFDRQRKQAELEAYRIKLAQDAELERERAMADLRIREQKAAAKVIQRDSKSDSPESVNHESKPTDESILLSFYSGNPLASQRDAAKKTGLSQPKIIRILNQLESNEIIHRNGNGVEILRNL